jgi:hypothetical protein
MEFNDETYVPPVKDTLKQMTKVPLVWLGTLAIVIFLVSIGWIISTGDIERYLISVILLIVATVMMVVALTLQYSIARQRIVLAKRIGEGHGI